MVNIRFKSVLIGLVCWLIPAAIFAGQCRVERNDSGALFQLHLSAECTDGERQTHAAQAAGILAAIKQGKAVDLSGVVVLGDLQLDGLPLGPLTKELGSYASDVGESVRTVPASFSIANSLVKGAVRHGADKAVLVIIGPLTLTGTTFEQSVDLSNTVFVEPVTLSGAVFLKDSYFVRGRFLRDLIAEKTAFGPHTRFHRSRFQGSVTFKQSGFNGLAEFLEVEFDKDADFSGAYFRLGTGFSGSRFHGLADFSEALFDREAFFTFSQFDGDAYFRRATFRSTADFDDAEFRGRDDFSKVMFEGDSRFARVKRPPSGPVPLGLENPQIQYGITLSLLVFSALLIAYLIRSR